MRQYESSAKCFTVGLVGSLIILLILLCIKACPQSIGVGIGYTSNGNVPVTFNVISGGKLGGYVTYVAETHSITPDYTGKWQNEFTLGASYKIMDDYPKISLLSGIGWNNTIIFERDLTFPNAIHSTKIKGYSYELGVDIQPFKQCKLLYLTVLISNYTGFKSMICLRHTFN